jgi:hypothetical protein
VAVLGVAVALLGALLGADAAGADGAAAGGAEIGLAPVAMIFYPRISLRNFILLGNPQLVLKLWIASQCFVKYAQKRV